MMNAMPEKTETAMNVPGRAAPQKYPHPTSSRPLRFPCLASGANSTISFIGLRRRDHGQCFRIFVELNLNNILGGRLDAVEPKLLISEWTTKIHSGLVGPTT